MECEDSRGYTPLFIASKIGCLINILELLEHGADVNHSAKSHLEYTGKTPLFRARSYETVMLLLKFGADPCIKANVKAHTNQEKSIQLTTAIEHLMKYNLPCVKAILDSQMCNDRENNLVLDFHVFEGDEKNEMSLFEAAKNNEISGLLLHPLLKIFINLKYKTVRMTCLFQIIFKMALVIAFTIIGIKYVEFTSCEILKTASLDLYNKSSHQHIFKLKSGIVGFQINETHSEIPFEDGDNYPIICHEGALKLKEEVGFVKTLCKFEQCSQYYLFYCIFLVLLVMLLLKEICEGLSTGLITYFIRMECIVEGLLVAISLAFAFASNFTIYIRHIVNEDEYGNLEYNHQHFALHLAAWMVFLVWINLLLCLRKIPIIGIYIFMAFDVFKAMLFVLLAFFPCFAAFTFGFYILLESNEGFESYTRTFIRTMAMMAGEFNFDAYFDYKAVEKTGGQNHSTQMMFILFVIIISIIVMNLLIALTVSKIDRLTKRSNLLQVKLEIKDLISLSGLVRNNNIKWVKRWINKMKVQMPILERLQRESCSQVNICKYIHILRNLYNVLFYSFFRYA